MHLILHLNGSGLDNWLMEGLTMTKDYSVMEQVALINTIGNISTTASKQG